MSDFRIESDARLLGPYLDEVATSLPEPERGLDELLATVATTPQQQRSFLPPLPTWRFQSMFSATKFVVAGVIVALFGGFLLSGVLTQPEETNLVVGATTTPDSTTTPVIELPAEIPEGIESGTLDTPLGPARWVALSGDAETLPDILRPIPVPSGYVSLDSGGTTTSPCPLGESCQSSAALWFSPDLLEWTPRPLPVAADFAQLTQAGGEYWLTVHDEFENEDGGFDLPTLWRSTDALEWEAVDLTGVEPPPPAVIDWQASLGTVAASGDAIVVPMRYGAQNSTSFLGLPLHPGGEDKRGESAGLERADDGSYRVLGEYGDEHARVRFEEADGGLRVIDAATGAALADLEGVGMDFIERWAATGGDVLAEYRLVLLQGDRVDTFELPEPDAGTVPWSFTLLGSDDGFIALQMRPDGLIQTWTSPDGTAWALDEVLGDDPGEPVDVQGVAPADAFSVWIEPHGLIAWWADGDASRMWVSSDGVEWRAHHPPSGDWFTLLGLGSGWIGRVPPSGLAFYSDDSTDPTVLDVANLEMKATLGGGGEAWFQPISANTIANSVYEGEQADGRREHTIITFDDLPASGRS